LVAPLVAVVLAADSVALAAQVPAQPLLLAQVLAPALLPQ
jgi:hypothetical protein